MAVDYNNNNKICYDLNDLKSIRKRIGITCAVFLVNVVICVLPLQSWQDSEVYFRGVALLWMALPFTLIYFLGALVRWIVCKSYLSKLKRRGMIVPETKEEYDHDLRKLVRGEVKKLRFEEFQGMIPAVIAVALTVCVYGRSAWIVWKYSADAIGMMFFATLMYVFWIFWAILFVIQSDDNKYKDETDPDPERKRRMPLGYFVGITLLVGVISYFVVSSIESMAAYLERSREAQDEQIMNTAYTAANCSYTDNEIDPDVVVMITFTENGFIAEGKKGDVVVSLGDFEKEFSSLLSESMSPVGLESLNEKLQSRHYDKLESFVITIDGAKGTYHVIALPKRKGAAPYEISGVLK